MSRLSHVKALKPFIKLDLGGDLFAFSFLRGFLIIGSNKTPRGARNLLGSARQVSFETWPRNARTDLQRWVGAGPFCKAETG